MWHLQKRFADASGQAIAEPGERNRGIVARTIDIKRAPDVEVAKQVGSPRCKDWPIVVAFVG